MRSGFVRHFERKTIPARFRYPAHRFGGTELLRWPADGGDAHARAVVITEPISAAKVTAVIDRELPMSQAAQAHRVMAAGEHIGKILLEPN